MDPETLKNAQELADDAGPEPNRKLGTIAAIVSIAVVVVAGLFWLFTMNANANAAKDQADALAQKVEKKADREEVRDGFNEINKRLDKINDYLMNGGRKR